ncbi:MAG: isochorismatase family protein [Candidatus Woesearchaeota archaeon]
MNIPSSGRKRALFIVDVQPAFLDGRNSVIVSNIVRLIKKVKYDLYVEAVFCDAPGSIWDRQLGKVCARDERTHTVDEIMAVLDGSAVHVEKSTKSIFKGNEDILALLKENGIEEVHLVGIEKNDCVLATACESFDFGFITYVIEECCQSSAFDELHRKALDILRRQCITNNSVHEKIEFVDV